MATVNLYLKDYKATKTAIRAVINDGRNFQIKLYSGISIKPKHWSKTNKCVLSADPMATVLNSHLKEFKLKVLDAYLKAKREGVKVTTEYLKNEVNPQQEEVLSFWEIWEVFLESKKGEFKPHSFAKFRTLAKHLKEFEKFAKRKLDLLHIDQLTLEDLQRFCYTEQNLNTQSTDKYIGLLKIFLNWAVKRKYSNNIDFQHFRSVKQPDSLKIIITDEEIKKMESADLGEKQYLRNAKELFILSCLTGLRFSDYSRVQKQHLKADSKGGKFLQIRQTKTNEFVEIPLNSKACKIVEELISGDLHAITNQKMNKYVKELCELAGVDESFEVHTFKGKDQTVETKPKYELITTHTGRRTFATRLLTKGIPAETVMQFTGHRDYKSFAKYVNIPKTAQMKAVKDAMFDSYMKVTA